MTLAAFIEKSRADKEDWKYTDLEELLAASKAPLALLKKQVLAQACIKSPKDEPCVRLVFQNGVFQNKASCFGTAPSCLLIGDYESGYTITLGEKTCLVSQPVELFFIADDNGPEEISLKICIQIGNNGRLSLLENHLESTVPTTVDLDIDLHANAKFVHGKIVSGGTHLAAQTTKLAQGSFYQNYSLLRGTSPARNQIDVFLEGEEAQASLNTIMVLGDREHADTTSKIFHKAPRCRSSQTCKTVLDDNARGVFKGKIVVEKDAQQSDGVQVSRALLLSDQAEIDAKPELEINADDVKCSHGSAIGDLDENAMFYLRSRGLSEKDARGLLIEGFLSEMLDDIQIAQWRDAFRQAIGAVV